MARTRTRHYEILALLFVAGGLAASVLIWQAAARTTSTTSGTTGGGDVFTRGKDAAACAEQAHAFTDYPLVWAGPSVLGYPLVYCSHSMTKTRRVADGQVSHPGGGSWAFGYGTCVTPPDKESCPLPITINIDPCALSVDGRTIPKSGPPAHSRLVRGAQAGIETDGVLSFELSPQIITIYAPPKEYLGQGVEAFAAEREANAILIAEALVPANPLASAAASALAAKPGLAPGSDTLIAATLGAANVVCP